MSLKSVEINYQQKAPNDVDHMADPGDIKRLENAVQKYGQFHSDIAGLDNPDLTITICHDFKLKFVFKKAVEGGDNITKRFYFRLPEIDGFDRYLAHVLFEEGQASNMSKEMLALTDGDRRGLHNALAKAVAATVLEGTNFKQGNSLNSPECIALFRQLVEMSIDYNYSVIEDRYLYQPA